MEHGYGYLHSSKFDENKFITNALSTEHNLLMKYWIYVLWRSFSQTFSFLLLEYNSIRLDLLSTLFDEMKNFFFRTKRTRIEKWTNVSKNEKFPELLQSMQKITFQSKRKEKYIFFHLFPLKCKHSYFTWDEWEWCLKWPQTLTDKYLFNSLTHHHSYIYQITMWRKEL